MNTTSTMMFRSLVKGITLFILFALLMPFLPNMEKVSLYNRIFPGRVRLPFGENSAKAYNLSLYSLPVMFASHEIEQPKAQDEYRVIVLGDSSVWGILLHPEETLSGQLNALGAQACGKSVRFYNLGYPTISILKDLMILDYATRYDLDAVIWLTTLESFVLEKQKDNPLVTNNPAQVSALIKHYNLPLPQPAHPTYLEGTLFGQRRALADWLRLQLYGVLWSASGIDQVYLSEYPSPQNDFPENNPNYYNFSNPLPSDKLAYPLLQAAIQSSSIPILLVNEPLFVSDGQNSQTRYNFLYPRWAYDQYREQMQVQAATQHWNYLDLWNLLPKSEFTNSPIHLTPAGEAELAQEILHNLPIHCP